LDVVIIPVPPIPPEPLDFGNISTKKQGEMEFSGTGMHIFYCNENYPNNNPPTDQCSNGIYLLDYDYTQELGYIEGRDCVLNEDGILTIVECPD